MTPQIKYTKDYVEYIGHYSDIKMCAKLSALASLLATEVRSGYAKFPIEYKEKINQALQCELTFTTYGGSASGAIDGQGYFIHNNTTYSFNSRLSYNYGRNEHCYIELDGSSAVTLSGTLSIDLYLNSGATFDNSILQNGDIVRAYLYDAGVAYDISFNVVIESPPEPTAKTVINGLTPTKKMFGTTEIVKEVLNGVTVYEKETSPDISGGYNLSVECHDYTRMYVLGTYEGVYGWHCIVHEYNVPAVTYTFTNASYVVFKAFGSVITRINSGTIYTYSGTRVPNVADSLLDVLGQLLRLASDTSIYIQND